MNNKIENNLEQEKIERQRNNLSFRQKYSDTIIFISLIMLFFGYVGYHMGIGNMFSTLMETAYKLLMDTVFYIMAIAVLAGAFGKMATEFGLINLLNKIFAPLIRPLYNLPGVSFLGIITTYLSDNPAIISLAKEDGYLGYFQKHEIPALCNLGTAFGMGLILTTFMTGLGYMTEAIIGNLGAIIGSIMSVRIMNYRIRKKMGISSVSKEHFDKHKLENMEERNFLNKKEVSEADENFMEKALSAMLEGGKLGVDIGLSIIPGVVVICTLIMILTFGAPEAGYQGNAFEGVRLLPKIGEFLSPILKPLFGFQNPESIAFPITALGAVGAALSLIPKFLSEGIIGGNEIAVFTAMGMCWSGFLSTHVAMMDALNRRKLISTAISSHFIGGLTAGIAANFIYKIVQFIL
ncbi:MAG: CD0519/CD1768 family membrane protein [Bacillota bacterium]